MKWLGWAVGCLPVLGSVGVGAIAPPLMAQPTPGDYVVEVKVEPRRVLPRRPTPAAPTASPQFAPYTAPAATPLAPLASFNSDQLDQQIQRYRTYLNTYGTPDILIVGSSRALQGVDPVALQFALAKQGFPNLKAFNFSVNGATAQVVEWMLQRLIPAEHLPKLLIWADGSRALNSGRSDRTFAKILSSPGYQGLRAGRSAIPVTTQGTVLGQICADILPLGMGLSSGGAATRMARSGQRQGAAECQQPAKLVVRQVKAIAPPTGEAYYQALGLQLVNTQFDPWRYFQQYPRVSGRYDGDYNNFSLVGPQTQALVRVAQFAQQRQIPLMFVNLPLTATYLDRARTAYEQQFQRQMEVLAQQYNFTFKDLLTHPELSQNPYFADPSHLNRHGAAAIARTISPDLIAPLATVLPRRSAANPGLRSALLPAMPRSAYLYFLAILAS